MKFVCDNCKAKYQIGDDKVAGKTLRMKCRRCGHMIQVAATVTESSVSQKLPTEPAAGSVPAGPGPLEGSSEDGATIVRPSPLFLFDNKTADRPAPVPPAPAPSGAGAPPRPGASTGNIPRPAGIGAPPGGSPRIVPPARPSLRNSNPPPAAPMHAPSSPGLHSGFQAAVAAPAVQPSATPGAAPLPTEDWYVGIGGVPLGPVRLSIVREKAANGQVDQESLVWREGFDEWLPIKSFPALSALVDEVKQQRISRNSVPTPSPPAAVAPLGFTPGVPAAASPAPSPAAPAPAPSAPARNPFASQPAAGALAAAARALAASAPAPASPASRLSTPSVPEAAPSIPFDLTRQSAPPAAPSAPIAIKDPFAPAAAPANGAANGAANGSANGAGHLAPPEAASTGMAYGLTTTAAVSGSTVTAAPRVDSIPPQSEVAGRKKKGVHPMVWAFIAMAAAFGGVAAWALFLRKPDIVYIPKEGEAVATQPGGAAPPPPPTGAVAGTTGAAEVTAAPTDSSVAVTGPGKGTGQLPPGVTAKPGETAAPLDTSGFGTGGPSGPSTAPTSGGGKGALNESQLNGVVSSNSPRVRRKCWDPLVSGRSPNAPNSVKVTATVKVAPSGAVKSVSTSGGNDQYYPGLASCVQSTVSGWTFPASDEGGTVVVPFGFNAQ